MKNSKEFAYKNLKQPYYLENNLKTTSFRSHLYGKLIMQLLLKSKHFWGRAKGDFSSLGIQSRRASMALIEFHLPLIIQKKEDIHLFTS